MARLRGGPWVCLQMGKPRNLPNPRRSTPRNTSYKHCLCSALLDEWARKKCKPSKCGMYGGEVELVTVPQHMTGTRFKDFYRVALQEQTHGKFVNGLLWTQFSTLVSHVGGCGRSGLLGAVNAGMGLSWTSNFLVVIFMAGECCTDFSGVLL